MSYGYLKMAWHCNIHVQARKFIRDLIAAWLSKANHSEKIRHSTDGQVISETFSDEMEPNILQISNL